MIQSLPLKNCIHTLAFLKSAVLRAIANPVPTNRENHLFFELVLLDLAIRGDAVFIKVEVGRVGIGGCAIRL